MPVQRQKSARSSKKAASSKSFRPPDPKRVREILRRLKKGYPNAECELHHENPLQLLVATILSAQCTDKRVNLVTPELFARYPDARAFAQANLTDLERMIRSTGFFRNKAANIQKACRTIVEKHGGEVPSTMEELVQLGGVGRKTANVILGNVFEVPGLVVDTHVTRLSNRLGFTRQHNAVKIEQELMNIIPKSDWTMFSHLLIFHGRRVCFARKPNCANCSLNDLCPSSQI